MTAKLTSHWSAVARLKTSGGGGDPGQYEHKEAEYGFGQPLEPARPR